MEQRQLVQLEHHATGRVVPLEALTVFGRHGSYHRYDRSEERGDRLRGVEDALSRHDYIQIADDTCISRTHGLLDPRVPGLCDLNSSNGTFLNGAPLPTRYGLQPPMERLQDGDQIVIGAQRFDVRIREVAVAVHRRALQAQRFAVVGTDFRSMQGAVRLCRFLRDRKGFLPCLAPRLEDLTTATFALPDHVSDEAIIVLAVCARAEGTLLVLDEDRFPLAGLLAFFQALPGRKVLALELAGDPTACEELFADMAREDMMLLTSPGRAQVEEPLVQSVCSAHLSGLRESVAGRSTPGAYDDLLDGLDALIVPDSNALQVDWAQGYEGRLRLSFGAHEPEMGSQVAHSLRLGGTTYLFPGREPAGS